MYDKKELESFRLEVDKTTESLKAISEYKKIVLSIDTSKVVSDLKPLTSIFSKLSSGNLGSNKLNLAKMSTDNIDLDKLKTLNRMFRLVEKIDPTDMIANSNAVKNVFKNFASSVADVNSVNTVAFSSKMSAIRETISEPILMQKIENTDEFIKLASGLRKIVDLDVYGLQEKVAGLSDLKITLPNFENVENFSEGVKSLARVNKAFAPTKPIGNSSRVDISYARSSEGFLPILDKVANSIPKDNGIDNFINSLKKINTLSFNDKTVSQIEAIGIAAKNLSGFRVSSGSFSTEQKKVDQVGEKSSFSRIISTVFATIMSTAYIAKLSAISKEMIDLEGLRSASGFDVLSNRVGIESLGGNTTSIAGQVLQKRRSLFDAQIFGQMDSNMLAKMSMLGVGFKSSLGDITKAYFQQKDSEFADYLVSSIYGDDMATILRRKRSAYNGADKGTSDYLNKLFSFGGNSNINQGEFNRFFINFESLFARLKHFLQAISGDSIKYINKMLMSLNMNLQSAILNKNIISDASSIILGFTKGVSFVFTGIGKIFSYLYDGLNGLSKILSQITDISRQEIFQRMGQNMGKLFTEFGILKTVQTFLNFGPEGSLGKKLGQMIGRHFSRVLFAGFSVLDIMDSAGEVMKQMVTDQINAEGLAKSITKLIIQIIGLILAVKVNPYLGGAVVGSAGMMTDALFNLIGMTEENNEIARKSLEAQEDIKKNTANTAKNSVRAGSTSSGAISIAGATG